MPSCRNGNAHLCAIHIHHPKAWFSCSLEASEAVKVKAQSELLQKIKEALPEETEPWLKSIVPQKLGAFSG